MKSLVTVALTLGVIVSPSQTRAQSLTTLYEFTGHADGGYPTAGLIKADGKLYGVTGIDSVLFYYDIKSGAENGLYSFKGGLDGYYPYASLLKVGGLVFGTTVYGGGGGCNLGGNLGCGTVFEYDLVNKNETVLYAFGGGDDGANPQVSLINVDGTLYGTTFYGGGTSCFMNEGCGTIFSFNMTTGAYKNLHAFSGGDGSNPAGALLNVGGILYGTTYRGGAGTGCVNGYGCGVAFSFHPKTRELTVLHSFSANGSDGASPQAGLINVGVTLYGTANLDGTGGCPAPYGCGTVFSMNPANGAVTALHEFTGGSDGSHPVASLIDVSGTLYGGTQLGGTGNCSGPGGCGVLFKIDIDTGSYSVLYSFSGGSDGAGALAPLINVGGALYSTTNGHALGYGTIFRLAP